MTVLRSQSLLLKWKTWPPHIVTTLSLITHNGCVFLVIIHITVNHRSPCTQSIHLTWNISVLAQYWLVLLPDSIYSTSWKHIIAPIAHWFWEYNCCIDYLKVTISSLCNTTSSLKLKHAYAIMAIMAHEEGLSSTNEIFIFNWAEKPKPPWSLMYSYYCTVP